MLNSIDRNDYLQRLQEMALMPKSTASETALSDNDKSMLIQKESMRMDIVSLSSKDTKQEEIKYNTTEDGYLPDFQLGDWSNTKSTLFGSNLVQINNVNVSIFLPQGLQEQIAENPELKSIIDGKINSFVAHNNKQSVGIDNEANFSVYSQFMALSFDENGEIMHTYIRRETINVYAGGSLSNGGVQNGLSFQNMQGFLSYQRTIVGFNSNLPLMINGINESSTEVRESAKNNIMNQNILANEGAIAIFEIMQERGSSAVVEVRKANGDIINLETGDIISKASKVSEKDK